MNRIEPSVEHEQFHAEYAPTGFAGRLSLGHQAFNGGTCDVARPLGLTIGFGSRLPGLAVIAGLLTLADRCARHNAGGRRNSQYRQLTLQRGKRLNDHARHIALIGGAAASCASVQAASMASAERTTDWP